MRYDDAIVAAALRGIHEMKESTTYQAILREGRIEVIREVLLEDIDAKFGFVPPTIAEQIQATEDVERLRAARRMLFQVSSLEHLVI